MAAEVGSALGGSWLMLGVLATNSLQLRWTVRLAETGLPLPLWSAYGGVVWRLCEGKLVQAEQYLCACTCHGCMADLNVQHGLFVSTEWSEAASGNHQADCRPDTAEAPGLPALYANQAHLQLVALPERVL